MVAQLTFVSSGVVEAEGIVAFRNIVVDDLPVEVIIPALSRVILTDGNAIDDINASAILANSWTAGYIRLFLDGVLVTVFPPLATPSSTTQTISALTSILAAAATPVVTPPAAVQPLSDTGVQSGTYVNPTVTVGSDGRIIAIRDGAPAISSLIGDVVGAPTNNHLIPTGVVPGPYLNTNLSVGADGRIIAAANGSAGAFKFIGTWDALTNTPVIPVATPVNQGWLYIVSVASAGVTAWPNVENTTYLVNDFLISNGVSQWIKQDNSGSVAGRHLRTTVITPEPMVPGDDIILVNVAGPAVVNLLPGVLNMTVEVKDASGMANINNITVTPFGAELIDGQPTFVIVSKYGAVWLIHDGSNWSII